MIKKCTQMGELWEMADSAAGGINNVSLQSLRGLPADTLATTHTRTHTHERGKAQKIPEETRGEGRGSLERPKDKDAPQIRCEEEGRSREVKVCTRGG